jgi:hypothetical protein
VLCVRKVGNLLITSFFIVKLQEIYRVCFLSGFGVHGLCFEG